MFRAIVLIFSLLLSLPALLGATKLSTKECRVLVKDFERMSNLNPQDIEASGPGVLEKLRNGETMPSYFIAFNIYVENLFNKGNVDKARQEMARMVDEAFSQSDPECRAIALRTQGQFYYKLGLYERAADCFRKGMKASPRYDSKSLEHYFTWSSILFWLVQSDLRTGRIEEAEYWISQMDEMMAWLDARGEVDGVGYKPVMIRGLKAKIALQHGNLAEAESLLAECPLFIKEDVPARAYVEYYVAKMQLYVKENRHEEALPLLDELIEMHSNDYKPIAAEYLLQKGKSLAALGRFEQSANILMDYIGLNEELNEVSMAQQLDELSTRYEVEKLQHERDNMQRHLWIVLATCIALAVIISLIIINQKNLRKKNRTLAQSISELNRLHREPIAQGQHPEPSEEDSSQAELLETGNRIVEFINRTECYFRTDCSRDTIKEGLGVNEHTLAKAIMAATGLSFVNYINQLRLKASITMLEENPDMTIHDISLACGFGTVRQFQRIFKQQCGLSPSAYREARKTSVADE